MIKTAVILAAGMGSRLGEICGDKPKGFLEIGGNEIIEMSIEKLIKIGIENIIIGTGHLSKEYEKLSKKYPQIKCVYNPKFSTTGSMYTLYNMRYTILDDFILLESDLVYDIEGLKALNSIDVKDIILASDLTNSHDEVFIERDKDNYLVNMSKDKKKLNKTDCELVGLTKVSYGTFVMMCDYAKKTLKNNPKLDYEEVLVKVSENQKILVNKVDDFTWCEIDDRDHLKRAIEDIYPMIRNKELRNKKIDRKVLLNPGPATTSDSVKYAQIVPDICPREKEFGDVMKFISRELVGFVGDNKDYFAILFGGSGTAAIESIISSVIDRECILIINNGSYGKRMCDIAKIYDIDYIEFKSLSFLPIDLDKLETTIKNSSKNISHLCVVHNETTTGLLNDIEGIGKICRRYNIKLIVDAMSSFGAIPIDMNKMNISYLGASSNKNLQGMPGISFVIANKKEIDLTKDIKPRNLYLNLYLQYKYFLDKWQMRFTPPVQVLYALKQAIIETNKEGIDNRYKRYCKSWETLIDGLNKLGLRYLVDKRYHSKIITAVFEPKCKNYDFKTMHDFFYTRGITIYPGKLDNLNTFRIANIGDITFKDIEVFLELLEEHLKDIGYIK